MVFFGQENGITGPIGLGFRVPMLVGVQHIATLFENPTGHARHQPRSVRSVQQRDNRQGIGAASEGAGAIWLKFVPGVTIRGMGRLGSCTCHFPSGCMGVSV